VLGLWRDAVLELTVWGSGTCPPAPVRLVPRPPATVEVTFSTDYGGACTADLAPTTWVLDLPPAVTGATALHVQVRGAGVPATDLDLAHNP
jgi:hypothetical protein